MIVFCLFLLIGLTHPILQEEVASIEALIGQLDHEDLAVREKALKRLSTLGKTAEIALRSRLGAARGETKLRIQKLIDGIEIAAIRNFVLDPIAEITLEGGNARSVAYSRDGKLLASGG